MTALQGQDQDTQASSDGAAGDRGADLPDVSTEASSDCGAITCGMLAEMIENVAGRFTTDCAIETAIEEIRDADMAVIEWICRLVPASVIEALKARSSASCADAIYVPGRQPPDRRRYPTRT